MPFTNSNFPLLAGLDIHNMAGMALGCTLAQFRASTRRVIFFMHPDRFNPTTIVPPEFMTPVRNESG